MKNRNWLENTLMLIALLFLLTFCTAHNKLAPAEYQKIQTGFITPHDTNTVWCYWYWINDDISKEGITKDLEAMKKVGIGAAFIGNINPPEVDGPVPILSDYWWECMVHAVNEGKRIGVDIGTFNSPGWSQSGGPWVKPEMAMRHMVYAEIKVKGPGKVQVQLPQPGKQFQDVNVMAFPAVQAEKTTLSNANSKISSNPEMDNISNLMDGDTTTVAYFLRDGGDYTIDIKSEKTITARSIQLFPGKQRIKCNCELYALVDGKYNLEKTFEFDRSNMAVNVGPDVYGPVSIALPGIASSAFRLVCRSVNNQWNAKSGFSEIAISEAPVLEHYVEKKLGKMFPSPLPEWNSYIWENQENVELDDLKIKAGNVIDISDKMDAGGILTWEVPEGEWTVMRFGMTPTGTKNSPSAPQGKGYEIDKASEEIARFHFDNYVGALLSRIPEESKCALKYVVADSYEQGSQNWTDNFEKTFNDKYGYSARKYLPVFAGRIVNSVEESNRFLWDLRRLVADEIAYEYVGGLRKISNENNLQLWLENYGHWGYPSEFLMYGGQSNLVGGEFWNEGSLGDIECKSASSAAHIYGKPVVSAEAFTASGKGYMRHPALLKKRGDWSFTEGINHFVLHLFIHQPDDIRIPGVNAWFGTEFNRHNTWFEQSETWIEYLRRCQHMLQQGQYVADVCYFIGEDAPMMTGGRIPELPAGYSYDYINAEVILKRLSVKDGKFVLPDGTSYKIMVLPPIKTMRPELLAKVEELVSRGGVILGRAPEKSPSLQNFPECDKQVLEIAQKLWGAEKEISTKMKKFDKGYVVDELDLETALEALSVQKDVNVDENLNVLWTHRSLPEMEIYFLTNQSEELISFEPSFRVSGMKPQLWDAVTGEIRVLNEYTKTDGRISVPLKMEAHRSWFVVFTNNSENVDNGFQKNFPELQPIHTINSEWMVDFHRKRSVLNFL
ncbi:MAG: glycosyl hydrolase [Cyclobacteriaceae bacterium]|nr:glycosyl hydrolase [Cyclobacteriaceae bacterium]